MLHRNLNIYPMLQNIRTTEQTVEARATVCAAISPNAAKTDLPGRNRASYRPWPVSEITCNRPPCAECLFRHQHHAPQTPTSRSRAAPPRAPPEDKPGQGCPTPAAALTASRALLPHPAAPPVFAVALPRKSGHGHTGQRPLLHSLVMSSSVLPLVSGTSFQTKNAATTHITP